MPYMRTQILLDARDHRRAKQRAADLGMSLSEYIRRVVAADLATPGRSADIRDVFDLGDSGGSDVAAGKDRMLGEAVAAQRGEPYRT